MLLRWLSDSDWYKIGKATHSVFDVPIDGTWDEKCTAICARGLSRKTHVEVRRLQVRVARRGSECLLGCHRGIYNSRRHLVAPVRISPGGPHVFRRDSAGLYAYKVIGSMYRGRARSL